MDSPQLITSSWASEEQDCSWNNGHCPFSINPVTGHFTVLISRDIKRIGCATTTQHGGVVGICQYGYDPGGQMHNARRCTSGETSSCAGTTPSTPPAPPPPPPAPGPITPQCNQCDKLPPKFAGGTTTCDSRIQTWINSARPGNAVGNAQLCNRKASWVTNKYCITACNAVVGYGYSDDGKPCC